MCGSTITTQSSTAERSEGIAALHTRIAELEVALAEREAAIDALKARAIKVQARLHGRTLRLWKMVGDHKNYLGQTLSRAERAEAALDAAGLGDL